MLYPTDEQAGYPEQPCCPVCHEHCDTIYYAGAEIVGCDRCIDTADAWEVPECFPEGGENG